MIEAEALLSTDDPSAADAAWACYLVGSGALRRGAYQQAGALLTRGVREAERAGDRAAQLECLNNLGVMASRRGRAVSAVGFHREVLALIDDDPQPYVLMRGFCNLAYAYLRMGRQQTARSWFERSLSVAGARRYPVARAQAAVALAELELDGGEAQAAAVRLEELLGDPSHVANLSVLGRARHALGRSYLAVGARERAREVLEASLEPAADGRAVDPQGARRLVLADALEGLGEEAEAERLLVEVLTLARDEDLPVEAERACTRLAALRARVGDFGAAYGLQVEAAAHQERSHRENEGRMLAEAAARQRTELYRLENERLQNHHSRLADTNRDLVRATGALQARLRESDVTRTQAVAAADARGALLATVSHELRTPLHAVIGVTDVLLSTRLTERQQELLSTVRAAGELTLGLVDDLLDLSQIDAGELMLHPVDASVVSILHSVASVLAPKAAEKDLLFDIVAAPDTPAVLRVDAARLQQLIVNLGANALKFTDEGRVLVRVGARDGQLRVAVSDTGPGVAAEDAERLFEPFVQGEGHRGGAGLGLAICRRLVRRMGGTIGVRSMGPGQGSTFWFTVAAEALGDGMTLGRVWSWSRSKEEQAARPDVGQRAQRLTGRVLLVDDDEVSRRVTRAMLERIGVKVEVARDGREAVSYAVGGGYDLVLMDCQMPELDGFEATRRIRAAGATVPVVAVTASAGQEDQLRCRLAGMDGFASKPMSLVDLRQLVTRWLGEGPPEDSMPEITVRL